MKDAMFFSPYYFPRPACGNAAIAGLRGRLKTGIAGFKLLGAVDLPRRKIRY
jgi:hypothetical protein